MALTAEQRFKVRYYLGFPDLPALPSLDTIDEEEITLLQRSSELEIRLTNLSQYAESQVISILDKLDSSITEMDLAIGRSPFKRIEDITFRDDELDIRWDANGSIVTQLANILGILPWKSIGGTTIGLEVV